jgi:hypothetical protein
MFIYIDILCFHYMQNLKKKHSTQNSTQTSHKLNTTKLTNPAQFLHKLDTQIDTNLFQTLQKTF